MSNFNNYLQSTERLIGIYEQYKTLSSIIVSEISLLDITQDNEAKRLHKSLITAFEKFDFSELTIEQAYKLDMRPFEDYDSLDGSVCVNGSVYLNGSLYLLMLFPLWMLPVVPKNIELWNIFGVKMRVSKERKLDSDHRQGMLAYGMMGHQFRYKKVLVEKYRPNLQAPAHYSFGTSFDNYTI